MTVNNNKKWIISLRVIAIFLFGNMDKIIEKSNKFIGKTLMARTVVHNIVKKIFTLLVKCRVSPKASEAVVLILTFLLTAPVVVIFLALIMVALGLDIHDAKNYGFIAIGIFAIEVSLMINMMSITKGLKIRAEKYGVASAYVYEV